MMWIPRRDFSRHGWLQGKKQRSREDVRLDTETHSDASPSPEDLLAARRTLAQLDALLHELPMDLRAVFVLFEIEGLGQDEIAHALDVPKGTVASRLRRARARLAAMLVGRRLVDRAGGGM